MDTTDIYHCDETRQFVKHTCPYCESDETWQYDTQNNGDYMETFHKCDSCDKEWTNIYEVVYSHTEINIYKED